MKPRSRGESRSSLKPERWRFYPTIRLEREPEPSYSEQDKLRSFRNAEVGSAASLMGVDLGRLILIGVVVISP